MSRFRVPLTVFCLVTVLTGLTYLATHAADGRSAPANENAAATVEGKTLFIVPSRAIDNKNIAIHDVRVKTIAGKAFLAGTQYSVPEFELFEGSVEWVSVDHIESMLVADNLEQMKKLLKEEEDK